ncbi:MAG: zinc ribbon domain-containing protein [Myxococcales bacterium]|nr:MAG: zinc ribbon domain-containing protein [Myxococcales bacterium]
MPIYEYECESHGSFELELPMRAASSDAVCGECGARSRRLLSVPNVAQLSSGNRKAHAINERSRFEPRVVTREARPLSGEPKLHAGHGRPWSIGH